MSDELVFTVEGSIARPARLISLAEAGLTERAHLQEWVLSHPEILGSDIRIVAFEFDRWRSHAGQPERDRLDVLGLDRSGRLVVAELKRDVAPETVEMQAIKYAAMASRFTPEILASQHARFLGSRGETTNEEEALELLSAHVDFDLSVEQLRKPRIVLVAADFPPTVTATAVWLSEMGIDIALVKFLAYQTDREIVLTVSRLYPVQDVEEFTIAPFKSGAKPAATEYPVIGWGLDDFRRLRQIANATTMAAMDLCSSQPGHFVSLREIEQAATRTLNEARGDLAGLTMITKGRFGRSNWPIEAKWAAGDEQCYYYRLAPDTAALWIKSATDNEMPPTNGWSDTESDRALTRQ